MPIVFPLDTQINHILISTGPNLMSLQYLIQHVKKIKSKKQNLISIYIYINIFMIGDDMSILKTEKNIEGNAHQILRPFLQIKVIFSNR